MSDERRTCDCGAKATRTVTISTIKGSPCGKLIHFDMCESCYVEGEWAEDDLSPQADVWTLAHGDAPRALAPQNTLPPDYDDGDLMEANY